MGRRELIVAMLQALLLALCPWLRTDRGAEVALRAADAMVPPAALDSYGSWVQMAHWYMARGYNLRWSGARA